MPTDRADHQQPRRRLRPEHHADQDRRADDQDAGQHHLAQRRARADVHAARVVRLGRSPAMMLGLALNWRRTSSIMPCAAVPTARIASELKRKISIAPIKRGDEDRRVRQVDRVAALMLPVICAR